LTVGGNSLFTGIATFRNNVTLANLTSSSNTLRFGSNSYLDQSTSDVLTFQINTGTDSSGSDSSFVFRTTEPGVLPAPDQSYDAFRIYSGGDYWNRLVRVYTNFHADNNAFVGGDLQVGAASTLIGAGSTLGSFKVGAGGTVITTTSTGLVGIGTTNPTSALTVKGNTSLETLSVSGGSTFLDNVRIADDNIKLQIGGGNDIEIYHSSGVNYIEIDSGASLSIKDATNTRAVFQATGAVDLYYGANKKFETLGAGVTVTGTTFTNQLNVSGISTLNSLLISSGIITASDDSSSGIVTYYGDVSNAAVGRWILGANGTSDYTFTGIGFTQTTNDPVLYLARGMVYEFVNNSGGAHPFEIRVSNGGAAYSDGVTNNAAATGVIRFEIPFNAPNTLYYQCTAHSGMGNTISVYPNTI